MEAKQVVVQKEIEVVTKKLVEETSITLTLTKEEATKLRTMAYTVSFHQAKSGSDASKLFWDIHTILRNVNVPAAGGDNFESQFYTPSR